MASIDTIEGIGSVYKEKLKAIGIRTTEDLLEKGARPAGRKELASQADIVEELILEWVNRADLMRVKGVGEEYSDLLETAGVDSVVELATRNAENLASKMARINEEKNLVRVVPNVDKVADWIDQANKLGRGVFY